MSATPGDTHPRSNSGEFPMEPVGIRQELPGVHEPGGIEALLDRTDAHPTRAPAASDRAT